MWRGDASKLESGEAVGVPPLGASAYSKEHVPATYVTRRERSVRNPSDGSTDTIVYVRVRYPNGREKEWIPECVDRGDPAAG